jgi:CheY-like chemotaxis protein
LIIMKTILVIEDNDEIRENTAELLLLNNYHVLTAENGNKGFELAKAGKPDLIICDMMMPESDGRTFLKLAKEEKSVQHVPIIFFSAGTLPVTEQNNLTSLGNGFLKKPFLEKDLLGSIQDVLGQKDGHHTLFAHNS